MATSILHRCTAQATFKLLPQSLVKPSPSPLIRHAIARRNSSTGAMKSSFQSYLITPAELSTALAKNPPSKSRISTAPRVIPLCASWFLPNDPSKRTGLQTFHQQRIPSARFFDIDAIKDNDSPYPHMLPTAEDFAAAMSKIGVRRDDTLVVYDSKELGIFSAPRVGWTLGVFGHPNVHVLNNFRVWVEEGYPTESGEIDPSSIEKSKYPVPDVDPSKVVRFAEMKQIALDYGKEGAEQITILDARSEGRWAGTEPEPRPGLPSGHIPGSVSVPVSELLDPKSKTLLGSEALRKVFEERGIVDNGPIVSSCGTGVTAAVVDAALKEAGWGSEDDRRLYDGSWTEWAQRVSKTDGLIKTKV